MINTISIALNGLRIGADPLEISVQGFLVQPEPTPAPFEPVGGFYLVPVWPRHEPVKRQSRKKNRDVSVMVEGCTLRTSVDEIDAGEVVEGCEATFSVAVPDVRASCTIFVVGCEEENELEVYLMAQAAMALMDD